MRVEIVDPRDIDARYCLRSYFEELGHRFDTGFDPAQSISASDEETTLPNGLLLAANLLGAAVGCGALKLHIDTQIAEVKRMWVASHVRGLGLGRRLLERLSAEAASRGMATLRLETNRSLSEAKRLYERAGFVEWSPSIMNRMRTIGSRKISDTSNSDAYAPQRTTAPEPLRSLVCGSPRRSRTEDKMASRPLSLQQAMSGELLGRPRRPPIRGHTSSAPRHGLRGVGCLKQLPKPVFQQFDGFPQGAELPNPDYRDGPVHVKRWRTQYFHGIDRMIPGNKASG
jgi:GNAT superfamily N-acetyltransferase